MKMEGIHMVYTGHGMAQSLLEIGLNLIFVVAKSFLWTRDYLYVIRVE